MYCHHHFGIVGWDPGPDWREGNHDHHRDAARHPGRFAGGAIGVFALPDVLRLIAVGRHTGELLVVASGTDGRIWMSDGRLTGAAVRGTTTLPQAVFELALVEDGWFYFTGGRSAPEPEPPVDIDTVLRTVTPQVTEWRDLLRRVPLDATVSLTATPPGAQVQLSALQWQILATVGSSRPRVLDVVTASGQDQVDVVRSLRDMVDAGLVHVATPGTTAAPPLVGPAAGTPQPPAPPATAPTPPATAPARPTPPTGPAEREPVYSQAQAAQPPAHIATPSPTPASPPVPGLPPQRRTDAPLVPISLSGDTGRLGRQPLPPATPPSVGNPLPGSTPRPIASDPPLPMTSPRQDHPSAQLLPVTADPPPATERTLQEPVAKLL